MYLFTFALIGDRERIANMIMDFPARDLAQLRRDVQARQKALATPSTAPGAPKASAKRRKP